MIVERKQYGCIQVLLVQIGLALYLIVLFLGTGPTGTIKPQVLRVQKVAEATGKQVSIATLLPQVNRLQLSAATIDNASSAQEILSLVAPAVLLQAIPQPQFEAPQDDLDQYTLVHRQTVDVSTSLSIYSLGSKPRAPTIVA